MPTLTTIVPCHQHARFLPEALASLDAQTRPPDEIILIDDASTDDSRRLLDEFAAGRRGCVAIHHDRRLGPAATFNDGIARATGDLIVILSGDDRLSPRYLELMEKAIVENGWSFAYADSHRFGSDEAILRFPEFSLPRLARRNFISASAMFSRDLARAIGPWDPRFDPVGYDDWDFWLRAAAAGWRGGRVEGCHLEWRQHPGNRTGGQSVRDVLEARWMIARKHGARVRLWMFLGVLSRAVPRAVALRRRRAATE